MQADFVKDLEKYAPIDIAESALRVYTHCLVVLQRCVVGCWTIQQDDVSEGSGRRLSYI